MWQSEVFLLANPLLKKVTCIFCVISDLMLSICITKKDPLVWIVPCRNSAVTDALRADDRENQITVDYHWNPAYMGNHIQKKFESLLLNETELRFADLNAIDQLLLQSTGTDARTELEISVKSGTGSLDHFTYDDGC